MNGSDISGACFSATPECACTCGKETSWITYRRCATCSHERIAHHHYGGPTAECCEQLHDLDAIDDQDRRRTLWGAIFLGVAVGFAMLNAMWSLLKLSPINLAIALMVIALVCLALSAYRPPKGERWKFRSLWSREALGYLLSGFLFVLSIAQFFTTLYALNNPQ